MFSKIIKVTRETCHEAANQNKNYWLGCIELAKAENRLKNKTVKLRRVRTAKLRFKFWNHLQVATVRPAYTMLETFVNNNAQQSICWFKKAKFVTLTRLLIDMVNCPIMNKSVEKKKKFHLFFHLAVVIHSWLRVSFSLSTVRRNIEAREETIRREPRQEETWLERIENTVHGELVMWSV